jgi:hypothetical protein
MKTCITTLLALLLLGTAGVALATTPDGQTPAEESVCDSETGAAYGLCNAYCEAMDCDSDDPHASANACSKVQAKFQQITGRDLPCEVPPVTCPCNRPADIIFSRMVAGEIAISSCSIAESGSIRVSNSSLIAAFVNLENGQCGASPGGVPSPTTPEEAQLCIQLLVQAANRQGVTCN